MTSLARSFPEAKPTQKEETGAQPAVPLPEARLTLARIRSCSSDKSRRRASISSRSVLARTTSSAYFLATSWSYRQMHLQALQNDSGPTRLNALWVYLPLAFPYNFSYLRQANGQPPFPAQ